MHARRPHRLIAAGLGLALFAGACDKPEAPPPDAPPPVAKPVAPTTQQLLDGPRKAVNLGNLPLTMDVPAGWAVNDHGEPGQITLQMLEGPILGGEAHITLRQRDNVSPERMKSLIEHARRPSTTLTKAGVTVDVRNLGDGRVIERRSIPQPSTRPSNVTVNAPSNALSDAPNELTSKLPAGSPDTDRPVEWRVTIFIQGGINYEQYELLFIDLSPQAYAANEKLLRGLIDSLKASDLSHPPL